MNSSRPHKRPLLPENELVGPSEFKLSYPEPGQYYIANKPRKYLLLSSLNKILKIGCGAGNADFPRFPPPHYENSSMYNPRGWTVGFR